MDSQTTKFSRRRFSLGLAAAPITAALGTVHFSPKAKADEPLESTKWIADTSSPPFGLTETFHRNMLAMPVVPFSLEEVELHDGPLKESAESNRSYLMRLSVDRLLHNFRVNAGLPSSARRAAWPPHHGSE